MKRSTRILLAAIFCEVLLGGIGWYLMHQLQTGAMVPTNSAAETGGRIGETIGMAMGGLGGLFLVMFILAKMKERKQG